MRDFIPLAVPNMGSREIELVSTCVTDGWISSVGAYVGEFEESVRRHVGARGAVAVSSGTTAIHLALRMAGVEAGDEVILPSLTFIAPANAVRQHGAWPVFLDVDRETWQLDPAKVRSFLREECIQKKGVLTNRVTGRRVAGILPVHILGHPAPLRECEEIAKEWALFILEDAAEVLGARYADGIAVGGRGRYVCFSFNGNKIVSTGGGGMIVSDDPEVAAYGRFLSTQAKSDPDEYIHSVVGYNYRLTNLQAALGVAQMERLETFIQKKNTIANQYRQSLGKEIPRLGYLEAAPGVLCTWWLYTVLLPMAVDRKEVAAAMRRDHIEVRPLWQPLHLSPAMVGAYYGPCPVAEDLFRRAVSLPSSTGLTNEELEQVVRSLRNALS